MVESLDENVGRLMDCLIGQGLSDRTVIIFTSDNGGLATSEGFPTSNLPLRAGKGWLYEGGIRVPTFVIWPGEVAPRSVSEMPVISTDFYPTILDIADLPLTPEQHRDGQSLVPVLTGAGELDRGPLFWHYPHYSNQGGTPSAAVRIGSWKLIQFYEDSHVELYDLAGDPGETRDLSSEHPERAGELLGVLDRWRIEVGARLPSSNPGYDPAAPLPDY
jgi:arylsulfatase A-like enzyme